MPSKKSPNTFLMQSGPANIGKKEHLQNVKKQKQQTGVQSYGEKFEFQRPLARQYSSQSGGGKLSPREKKAQKEEYLHGAGGKVAPQNEDATKERLLMAKKQKMQAAAELATKEQMSKKKSPKSKATARMGRTIAKIVLKVIKAPLTILYKIPVLGWILAVLFWPVINVLINFMVFVVNLIGPKKEFKNYIKAIPASILCGIFATGIEGEVIIQAKNALDDMKEE